MSGEKNPMFGRCRSGNKNPMFGKYHTEESKQKMRETHFKGDDAGYAAIHIHVRKYLLQPELCESCKLKPSYDLANITGIYNREFKNWKYLCRSCHMKQDGRIYNLKNQGCKHDK